MATKKTPTKASVTKASEEKTPAKKVATKKESAKAADATKPVKKAATVKATKETPTKKAAAPVVKKETTAKKAVVDDKATKASPVKKTAVKKTTEQKEKMETKEKKVTKTATKAAAKPAETKEKAETKTKATTKADAKPKKEKVEAKVKAEAKPKKEKVEAKTTKTTATKEKATAAKEKAAAAKEKKAKAKAAPKKPARRKAVFVPAPPVGKSEIVDAVRLKPRKNVSKPGHVIAIRTVEKEEVKEEVSVTMEKYNPEQRSILDDVSEATGPIYRYSDEELNEFRALITSRLEKARKELNYLQGLITRKDEEGTEDTDNRFNHMEDGSGAMEREQLSQLAGRQVQFISHLENAMVRIENKTYGVCRVTGNLIDKARLRAVPHATLSIEAKNNLRRNH